MNKIFTTLSLSALGFFGTIAQNSNVQDPPINRCGSPKVNHAYEAAFQEMLAKHERFANGRTASVVYNIPVIFHILHSGVPVNSNTATTGRNISQAQVNSQITVLNQDFRKTNTNFATTVTQSAFVNAAADCEINFCAAKVSPTGAVLAEPGIDRINVSTKGWSALPYTMSYIESTVKPGSSWDPTKYLNIWILEFGGADIGTLGYAQFPTIPSGTAPVTDMVGQGGAANTDGVVFDYQYVGTTGTATSPYNLGRTATHEIGHWLGLWHINGDTSCGNDYCSDTPAQSSLTGGCPSTTGGTSAAGCGTVSPNPPGKMYQNYMDYSDDRCMSMFTAGQKARIQAVMANCVRRTSLTTSTVCSTAGVEENVSNIEMTVYPNPTNGELFVDVNLLDTQDFTISVVNTLGQTVKEVKQVQSNGGKIKIDLSDKNVGVYFVSIKSKSGSKVKRIVLQ
ncbi:MAG: T9SS type A sorting domain-containing protein [Bacteroidetes bacterium]|nr:T9SS type A sorting domain-containing protein [Bacteroidota bacterium]